MRQIPISQLLSTILSQHGNSTLKDVSGIVTNVMTTLKNDIGANATFISLYRTDMNDCIDAKLVELRKPLVSAEPACSVCKRISDVGRWSASR